MAIRPCCPRWDNSTIRVEKVVKPPQNPMAAKGRTKRAGDHRSTTRVTMSPSSSDPATLTANVDHGNPRAGVITARLTPYRARVPSAPPAAMAATRSAGRSLGAADVATGKLAPSGVATHADPVGAISRDPGGSGELHRRAKVYGGDGAAGGEGAGRPRSGPVPQPVGARPHLGRGRWGEAHRRERGGEA